MHKKVQSLVLAGMISANTLYPVAEVFADNKTGIETRVIAEEKSNKQIYLSDIDCLSGVAGWGEVRKDSNVEGNGAIKLIIDGETVEFGKGMGAHANSTLVRLVASISH